MFQVAKLWAGGKSIDEELYWDTALRILQKLDPRLVMTRLSLGQRIGVWARFWLGSVGFRNPIDIWLDRHKRSVSEVAAGVAVPLDEKRPEDRAFEIQVRVLEYAIQLRKAVYGHRKLTLADLPEDQQSEKARARSASHATRSAAGLDGAAATVREFIARIQEDTIRSDAQDEIVADYWNKLAFVAWERATLDPMQVDQAWLERARKYIDIARRGRPNWTPAQLNLARITAAEGGKKEALKILGKVLGKKKEKPEASSAAVATSDSDAIADMILKMAVERNAKAVAGDIQRSYGALSQETVRTVIQTLAGKVDAGLLNDIFTEIPIKAAPPPP